MILVLHHNNRVMAIEREGANEEVHSEKNIARQLFFVAKKYPEEWLLWCETSCRDQLNKEALPELLHHKRLMYSYGDSGFLGPDIGFVENSPFIKIIRKVQYPTWQMSSQVGAVHCSVLNTVETQAVKDVNFSYFLNSLAKVLMPLGLFCYQSHGLLKKPLKLEESKTSSKTLFRFVKQHYKTRWLLLLFINLWVYKKQVHFPALLSALFYKKRTLPPGVLDTVPLESSKPVPSSFSIDVVIPTIGRTGYVKAVINDLAKQTQLPEKVIVIEQNPDAGSTSELELFFKKEWPFQIKHFFTHQTGACHARNLGLKEVTADWIFLADDDNVLEPDLIQSIFMKLKMLGMDAITTSYLQKNEQQLFNRIVQWHTFGAGNSFVRKSVLGGLQFDETLEHGYGEDADFGMQLRNKGVDIIYVPNPSILHLKAPMGGFRTKPVLPWSQESRVPKPSPTIMRFYQKHRTKEQILGYKTGLFLKYYRKQAIKNPFRYFRTFKTQWNQSVFWAEKLTGRDDRRET